MWQLFDSVDVAGGVVRECLGGASCDVVFSAAAKGAAGVKLLVEEADETLYSHPFFIQLLSVALGVLEFHVRATRSRYEDAFFFQLFSFVGFWPVGVVTDEPALESALEKGIQALHVVAVTGQLFKVSNAAAGRKDQVLAHADEPALQRCAVTLLDKAV